MLHLSRRVPVVHRKVHIVPLSSDPSEAVERHHVDPKRLAASNDITDDDEDVFSNLVRDDEEQQQSVAKPFEEVTEEVLVGHVRVTALLFGKQCVWVHIGNDFDESRATKRGIATPQAQRLLPSLGSLATAVPIPFAPYLSETVLLDGATEGNTAQSQGSLQDQDDVAGGHTSPQTVFARSLARRLTKKYSTVASEGSSLKGCVISVACGISGPLEGELLGSHSGSVASSVLEFGGLVFTECVSLINEGMALMIKE